MHSADFFTQYLSYTGDTEVPTNFNRWAAISGLGAYLGRTFYLRHGHFVIYPNLYTMLMGSPGTRKSSAIKMMKALLMRAGYTTFACDKTSKEKFLLELNDQAKGLSDEFIFGEDDADLLPPVNCFIAADEFNDFFATDALGFISMLGNLWDYRGIYENKVKGGESARIPNPTISILGGNTPTNFATVFPPEALGQGFLSRLLLIHGEPNGRKIAFPESPSEELQVALVNQLQEIKFSCHGEAILTPEAKEILTEIYEQYSPIPDIRFDSYSNRRFNHLLKLCLVHAASEVSNTITADIVIRANTILHKAETLMPKALGEYGRSKTSDTQHKVLQVLYSETKVFTLKEIWQHVYADLGKMRDLQDIMQSLVAADKVQSVTTQTGVAGFIPKQTSINLNKLIHVDTNKYLTDEEMM